MSVDASLSSSCRISPLVTSGDHSHIHHHVSLCIRGQRNPPTDRPQTIATIKYQIDDGVRHTSEQAWNRGYTNNPNVKQIPVLYPLHDLRAVAFPNGADWSWSHSAEILKDFGFTAIKFDPKWAKVDDEVQAGDYDDLKTLEETYFPEVKDSVLKLTGAARVFITNSIVRRGDAPVKKPVNGAGSSATVNGKDQKSVPDNYKASDETRPTHLASSDNSRPARGAHVDYTPVGARRSIRRWRPDIYKAALEAGIIDAEDKICASASLDAQDKASNDIIDAKYNADGKLGPRYAAYSVWRPMRTVTRDPLAMAPRWSFPQDGALGFLGYESRMLAAPSMGGDFLRELESVVISEADARAYEDSGVVASGMESPKWYYLPEQKPDEVIVLKFFDSAALGEVWCLAMLGVRLMRVLILAILLTGQLVGVLKLDVSPYGEGLQPGGILRGSCSSEVTSVLYPY